MHKFWHSSIGAYQAPRNKLNTAKKVNPGDKTHCDLAITIHNSHLAQTLGSLPEFQRLDKPVLSKQNFCQKFRWKIFLFIKKIGVVAENICILSVGHANVLKYCLERLDGMAENFCLAIFEGGVLHLPFLVRTSNTKYHN